MTDFEFIAHFYMAKQIVPTNKRIVVMSWITLLCMQISPIFLFSWCHATHPPLNWMVALLLLLL